MTQPQPQSDIDASVTSVDRARLVAAEHIATAHADLDGLRHALEGAPRWRPSRGLIAQCDAAATLIDSMHQRMQRKLIVAIVGPTGAGKSTLLNALAGVDGLSASGMTRPTTRDVVVFCRDPEDAAPLKRALGDDAVGLVTSPSAHGLNHVVLVDTPDINSAHMAVHRPIVEAVIGQADVLVCVFNVENPKSRENADFLAPFVAAFPSRFVLAVLNRCDRQDETELKRDIKPDFSAYLQQAWDRPPADLLCISARRHLRRPDWPVGAEPRHDFDEFGRLRETLFGSLNQASVVLDARIERARHLVAVVHETVTTRAAAADVKDVETGLVTLRKAALNAAASALGEAGSSIDAGTNALYYQRLAQAWWGPVGWLVGMWARLLVVGAGFANILRFGRPLRQLWGVVSSLARFKKSQSEVSDAKTGTGVQIAAVRYRQAYERAWPDLGERLVVAGFEPALRDASSVVPDAQTLDDTLNARWNEALSTQLTESSKRLSGWWLQIFLNAWVLLPAGFVAVESVVSFVQRELLSGDYFRHALITIAMLWFLAFAVFQMAARAAGGQRLLRATFRRLLATLASADEAGAEDALAAELRAVRRLGAMKARPGW
ncbi:MAG: energy-coupling factor transporter ATP-binding protein EcfA2 [Myxococcota bacterium]|jgi:energy-coupling factor transporter ATP-binding protein EcfA2